VIQPVPRQPESASLIRHRRYTQCVVCERRRADKAVTTKWWTCQKCEGGVK
jgi:ribosomal protein L37AE/L43A